MNDKLRYALETIKDGLTWGQDSDVLIGIAEKALAASKQEPQAKPASEADMKVYGAIASNYFKDASKPEPQRCKTCDGTGDIHRIDGEYLGECPHCKPEPVGINGLTYAEESATASVLGIVNSKPEPQAQAGEPEVVARADMDRIRETSDKPIPLGTLLITQQSHREAMAKLQAERDLCEQQADYWQGEAANFSVAIAKKDAALKACVEVIKRYRNETPLGHQPHMIAHVADAAITQTEGALK